MRDPVSNHALSRVRRAGDACAPARDPTGHERGSAIVIALLFVVVVVGIVVSGSSVVTANRQKTETNFRHYSQAVQFARAGMTETLAWFRRQTNQPVTVFEPRVDTSHSPPILDSDDPDIGIVREFRIAGSIWGRYELWKSWDTDPDPVRRQWRAANAVRDVSQRRGSRVPGTAWSMRCIGYVFHRADADAAYDERPNHVLSQQVFDSELLRLRLTPPGTAALCIENGAGCTIDRNVRVIGGPTGAGIFYRRDTGDPVVRGSVTGAPGLSPSSEYDGSLEAVFGANLAELKSIADEVVSDPDAFPTPLPSSSLVVVDAGAMRFDSTRRLVGNAVVCIVGDVRFAAGNNTNFSGLLYIDGDLTVEAPAEFSGSIVVAAGHRATLRGVGDWITVSYDDEALNTLRQEIGQYRLSGAIRPTHGETR